MSVDGISGMDLRAGWPVVVPDNLLIRRNFARACLPGENNVAVRQHRAVAEFTFSLIRIRPRYLSTANDVDSLIRCGSALPFSAIQEGMLGKAISRQGLLFLNRRLPHSRIRRLGRQS